MKAHACHHGPAYECLQAPCDAGAKDPDDAGSAAQEPDGHCALPRRHRHHVRSGRLFADAIPHVLRGDWFGGHNSAGRRRYRQGLQTDHYGGVRYQRRARLALALCTRPARRHRASWRAETGVFHCRESQQPVDRRPRDLQRHAAAKRHLFQQNPMLLLH